jgi:hypothetical protein
VNDDSQQIGEIFYEDEGHDDRILKEPLEHLHHSLRESFVSLPPFGTRLNQQQLDAIFGGDLRVLSDVAKLAYPYHINGFETEL